MNKVKKNEVDHILKEFFVYQRFTNAKILFLTLNIFRKTLQRSLKQ